MKKSPPNTDTLRRRRTAISPRDASSLTRKSPGITFDYDELIKSWKAEKPNG